MAKVASLTKTANRTFPKLLACAALFALVAFLDWVTGYEVTFFPVYFLAIGFVVLQFGSAAGYVACAVAAALWVCVDALAGHHFSREYLRYVNGAIRMSVYFFFIYGLSLYVKSVQTHRTRLERLRRLTPICHGCGKILWQDGAWKTVEEAFASAKEQETVECPTCREVKPAKPRQESQF